jgi:hypothetical protein
MVANKTPFYQSIPGLWYDRRQDAHTTDQRPDGNTWAPFLELPWARSGQGVATDGLSKYDLTRFNPWYYQRFREFARLCDQNGLVMIHHLYDTHNVLEIPPHWNDYAFRPKNNINETNLPEPPPADGTPGGKNLHLGNQVYNVESPQLRELHRKFILHELDSLGDQPNVIFSLSFQFVGPLAFQQFFQDTVAEWEKQHGKHVKIALITTKDITDAILNDPVRSKQVVMVDTRYWQYRPDGSLFAPLGGRNLAFREMVAEAFRQGGDNAPATSAEQAYRQVREYREKYPQLALAAWNNGVGAVPAFMAGAAQVAIFSTAAGHNQGPQIERTSLDPFIQQHFSAALMNMSPNDRVAGAAWSLADQKLKNILVYSASGPSITLDAELPVTAYSATWFDPAKGTTQPCPAPTSWAKGTVLTKPDGNGWMLALQAGAPE